MNVYLELIIIIIIIIVYIFAPLTLSPSFVPVSNLSLSINFISHYPLPYLFHLPTTLYLNITLYFSLHLPFFCPFLFTPSSYIFVIFSSILYILFPHRKKKVISLSLSLSFFWWIFYFSFISTLG